MNAVELAAVDAQPADVRAGGEERAAELDLLLRRQLRRALGASSFITLVRSISSMSCSSTTRRAEQRILARLLALQVALRAAAAGCRADRARARRAGSSRRRPPRAASARSWRPRARRRSGDGRPCGRHGVRPPSGGESLRHARLDTHVEHQQHLIAGLDHRVAGGTKPPPSRRIEITSEPSGRPLLDQAPRGLGALGHLELDDLEPLLGQVEQVDEPVLGTSCSISRRIRSWRRSPA